MTKEERRKPDILAASRKRRIAAGAGVHVAEVNKLLNQHRQMADTFKAMSRDGGKSFARMAQAMGLGGPGGMPGMPGGAGAPPAPGGMPGMGGTPPNMADMEKALKQLGGGKMPDMAELQKMLGKGGGMPGLPPGFNPFKKN